MNKQSVQLQSKKSTRIKWKSKTKRTQFFTWGLSQMQAGRHPNDPSLYNSKTSNNFYSSKTHLFALKASQRQDRGGKMQAQLKRKMLRLVNFLVSAICWLVCWGQSCRPWMKWVVCYWSSGWKVVNKHGYVARAWTETSCNPIWSSAYSNRHGRVGSFLSKPKEENPGDQALMLCYEGFRVTRWSGSEVFTVSSSLSQKQLAEVL